MARVLAGIPGGERGTMKGIDPPDVEYFIPQKLESLDIENAENANACGSRNTSSLINEWNIVI